MSVNLQKIHEDKLTEIYKTFFGYYRVTEEEDRKDIEREARQLSKSLANENLRFIEAVTGKKAVTN